MIEPAIRALLLADAGLTALIDGRVYPGLLPQDPTYPAVTYQVVAGVTDYAMEKPSKLAIRRVQFDCFARSYATAAEVERALANVLSGYAGQVGAPPIGIYGAFKIFERSWQDEGLVNSGSMIWRRTVDYNIWYQEE